MIRRVHSGRRSDKARASWNKLPEGGRLVVPPGTRLFHGTGEPIEGHIRTCSWGDVLWTAKTPGVAQSYIPTTGAQVYSSLDHVVRPVQDPTTRKLQRLVGLIYDYDKVEWGGEGGRPYNGGRAHSWPFPVLKGWGKTSDDFTHYMEFVDAMHAEAARRLLKAGLIKPDIKPPYNAWTQIQYRYDQGDPVRWDYRAPGRLYVGVVKRPLLFADISSDGEYQANEIGLFERVGKSGLDGIKIGDMLQSERHGNVYHYAYGLTCHGLRGLDWTWIEAVNWDPDGGGWDHTPEWTAARKSG